MAGGGSKHACKMIKQLAMERQNEKGTNPERELDAMEAR